jgi:ABC-2 type transport system ATP-binding protein
MGSRLSGRDGPNGSVVVRAVRLTRGFGDLVAVNGVDLEVAAGQVRAVVGLNGAGKSTLLRLIVGLLRPDAGRAEVWGHRAWQLQAAVRARIGYVAGGRTYPELTVTEHLNWSARMHGCPGREARRRTSDLLDRLALSRWASKPTRTLSGGNRQRLAVASALIHDPDLLILDEPTNALDPAGVIELRRLIAERADRGIAVVVSSHHLDEVARVASAISVMHDGRIVGDLAPDGIDLERQFFATVAAASGVDR